MAKSNMPSKSNKKKNPTVTRLSFEVPAGGQSQFVDIGLALSIVNRKFFRAGLFYYINSVEVYNNEQGVVDIHTAPDNWVTRNAHTRGEAIWNKMNDLAGPPLTTGILPKYHDFKVYLTALHKTNGTLRPEMYNVNAAGTTMAADEWVYSQFVSADDNQDGVATADEFTCHLLGPHVGPVDGSDWSSIGLIESYENTRRFPQPLTPILDEPSLPIDPLVNIFDFSSEEQMNEIITNLTTDNDECPYTYADYIGSTTVMQHVARIGTEVGLGRVGRSAGFCAPYGLICIDPHSFALGEGTSLRVVLNLAAGSYKGVFAESA